MNGTIAAQAPRISNSMPLARPRERAIRILPPLNGFAVWSDMTHLRRGTRLLAALLTILPATARPGSYRATVAVTSRAGGLSSDRHRGGADLPRDRAAGADDRSACAQ